MPRLVEQHRASVRILSIPCATGEEPLSLAMALNEAGWFSRASIEIHPAAPSHADPRRAGGPVVGLDQSGFGELTSV